MEGKEKAAAAAVEVSAETIFEERSLPRSLTPFLLPWLLLLLLPYHQFPSCQFSSGEKRGEERRASKSSQISFSFLSSQTSTDLVSAVDVVVVSNEMVVIRRKKGERRGGG